MASDMHGIQPYSEDVFRNIPLDTIQFAKVLNEPISEQAMDVIRYNSTPEDSI
jgi:hypothetical protein